MNRFKKARLILGLTQIELAEKLGVSTMAISKWEHGQSIPTVKRLRQVAEALNTTVAELIDEPKRRKAV